MLLTLLRPWQAPKRRRVRRSISLLLQRPVAPAPAPPPPRPPQNPPYFTQQYAAVLAEAVSSAEVVGAAMGAVIAIAEAEAVVELVAARYAAVVPISESESVAEVLASLDADRVALTEGIATTEGLVARMSARAALSEAGSTAESVDSHPPTLPIPAIRYSWSHRRRRFEKMGLAIPRRFAADNSNPVTTTGAKYTFATVAGDAFKTQHLQVLNVGAAVLRLYFRQDDFDRNDADGWVPVGPGLSFEGPVQNDAFWMRAVVIPTDVIVIGYMSRPGFSA